MDIGCPATASRRIYNRGPLLNHRAFTVRMNADRALSSLVCLKLRERVA